MLSIRDAVRRILRLLTLGALAISLTTVCLWWLVFDHPDWIRALPDTRTGLIERSIERLFRLRLNLPSKDANDNGMPDWYEATQGLSITGGTFSGAVRVDDIYPLLGERTRLRLICDADIRRYRDIRWPIDMEVVIRSKTPILLAAESPKDVQPTTGPLRVKLSAQGRLEFDVLLREHDPGQLEIAHARSGVPLTDTATTLFLSTGWRLEERPSHVELAKARDPFVAGLSPGSRAKSFGPPTILPGIAWEPHPDPEVRYVLQAADRATPDHWIGINYMDYLDAPWHWLDYGDPNTDRFRRYRVIAVSKERPTGKE